MDPERGRDFRKKKYNIREKEEKTVKKTITILKSKEQNAKNEENVPQTILLKTRDGEKRAVSPQASSNSGKPTKDGEPVYQLQPKAPDISQLLPNFPEMKTSVKLINPETLAVCDTVLEYLTDASDFLVIGCLGYQGVGKSTIMSKLAAPLSNENLFPVTDHSNPDMFGTEGVDVYVTQDRVILLDAEPILSTAFLNGRFEEEVENEAEMLSLQYAAFLLSICHILIVVQDYTFDPDVVRFLQAAEMLKPSSQPQPDDDPSLEYFPYVILLHNKVEPETFARTRIKEIQEAYRMGFLGSKLPVSSGIGIGSGTILRSLNPELCGEPLNLFLLPHFDVSKNMTGFNWNLQYDKLFQKMTMQMLSLPPVPLSHPVLTEKNWWHYIHKTWEDIKKSTFLLEYNRLLPTQASAKNELGST